MADNRKYYYLKSVSYTHLDVYKRQTWYISISHHGESMLQKLLPAFEAHETYREEEKVRIDILKPVSYTHLVALS